MRHTHSLYNAAQRRALRRFDPIWKFMYIERGIHIFLALFWLTFIVIGSVLIQTERTCRRALVVYRCVEQVTVENDGQRYRQPEV
ncbi:hypothetical protein [Dictyobacter alpinus]|uniref:hypothetical protein n=1 Tax=Dictyobacter alpinus TaxID=2014873 RepID=UPI000F830DB8|nr:hypothetical protein [Dictyobacter alpinus]